MRRKWAYLGAVLPLSTAVSAWASAGGSDPELPRPLRKNGMLEDDGSEKSAGNHEESLQKASPAAKAPPRDASQDDVSRQLRDGELDSESQVGDLGVQVSVPNTDGSMYAPASNQAAGLNLASGGGGSGGAVQMIGDDTDETTAPAPIPTENPDPIPDPVLIDPADTDAMLILLGGMAEGSGDGAMSTGGVVFDIVD
jgi:hypothetical protein